MLTQGVVAPQEVRPPLSSVMCTSRNVKVPSFRAPLSSRITIGWRVGVATNSSSRENTRRTGRDVALARKTQIGSNG